MAHNTCAEEIGDRRHRAISEFNLSYNAAVEGVEFQQRREKKGSLILSSFLLEAL
jgi:hypothetical protein